MAMHGQIPVEFGTVFPDGQAALAKIHKIA